MLFSAENGILRLPNGSMDYVRFGRGEKILIILPGLGEALARVKGTALPMALMYRAFSKEYTVYMPGRCHPLSPGVSTRDMARDLRDMMDALLIQKADLLGVSMGGMIAQHFAADYPARVGKLVLAATCEKRTPLLEQSVGEWVSLARRGDHAAFMDSNVRRIYSPAYYKKNKWLIPITGLMTKPKSYERFFIEANTCLTHDAADRLSQIAAPTLVIGGERDAVIGADSSARLAAGIPGAALHLYSQWGHGVYEEAKDFQQVVLSFLLS